MDRAWTGSLPSKQAANIYLAYRRPAEDPKLIEVLRVARVGAEFDVLVDTWIVVWRYELPSGDLTLPSDDLKLPSGDLKLPSGDLKLPSDDPKLPSGDLKLPSGDLKLPSGDIKLPSGDLVWNGMSCDHRMTAVRANMEVM